jgi:hypothetical protein
MVLARAQGVDLAHLELPTADTERLFRQVGRAPAMRLAERCGLDVLRHGGMDNLLDGIRAPSTLGLFLRAFTWGNVRQLEKSAQQLLVSLARHTPLLPGVEVPAFLDINSMQRRT